MAMFMLILIWGGSFAVTKTAVAYLEPEFLVLCRMCLGAAVFLLCWKRLRRTKIFRKDIPILIVMVLFEPCMFFLLESYALMNTSSSQAGMIVATAPLFTAIAAWTVLREKPSFLMWLGFIISIFGIVLLNFNSAETSAAPNPILGNILQMLGMCCGAGFIVCVRLIGSRYPPFFMAAYQAVAGSVFFIILNIARGTRIPDSIELVPMLCILYLGVLMTVGGISFFNYAVARLPAATSAGLLNLVPFVAVLIGAFVLNEDLSAVQWVAGMFVITGVLISQRAKVHVRARNKTRSASGSSAVKPPAPAVGCRCEKWT